MYKHQQDINKLRGFCLLEYNIVKSVEERIGCYLLHGGIFNGLFLDNEDDGNMYLRNVGFDFQRNGDIPQNTGLCITIAVRT
jgi:hypothetical protein